MNAPTGYVPADGSNEFYPGKVWYVADPADQQSAFAAFMADRLAMANSVAACQARIAESKGPIEQMAEALSRRELLNLPVREMNYEVTKGAETVHRHTEPTAPRWPLTVATDGERNGRLAWVPGL